MATLSPLVHLVRGWPPNSPDLNPIETVWRWVKHTLNLPRAETLADFRRIVQDVWDSMAQKRIDNLVDSYEARIEAVKLVGGKTIQPCLSGDSATNATETDVR
jgi:hypothetical protein